MQTLKIIVAEDVSNLEIDLQNRLNKIGHEVIALVSKPEDTIRILDQKKADLVVMDTYSDLQNDGFSIAAEIRDKYKTPVLFLSAEDKQDFSRQLEEYGPCIFLNKPVSDNELRAAITITINNEHLPLNTTAVTASQISISPYIFVRADYRLNKIRLSDIYYLEAKKDYVIIHTGDNVYTVHATMKEMLRVLPENMFIRTHRSYIVNLDKVFSIKYPDLIIENKMKTIPIGGLYRKSFFEKINII
jgi:DNA-binding LytR/AlgR family response regulator